MATSWHDEKGMPATCLRHAMPMTQPQHSSIRAPPSTVCDVCQLARHATHRSYVETERRLRGRRSFAATPSLPGGAAAVLRLPQGTTLAARSPRKIRDPPNRGAACTSHACVAPR
eukprot:360672-Chlamydomonas_euryale.AAC.15